MASHNRLRGRNPNNPSSPLYKKLTRLLSGPIVNYRRQATRINRRDRLGKFGSTLKSASGQQFKKTQYDPFKDIQAKLMSNAQRAERYLDFDQMEYTPEIASALDIYADEMTTSSALETLLHIHCLNEEIKETLHVLFYNVLNIEHNLFGWARTMCKFGDTFLYMDIDEELGIKNVIGLPSSEIERMEGEDKTNPQYIQFQWNSGGMTFENWQLAHFRILGNDKYAPYGTSVLEAARRIWRQLTLLEDAMMAYRIVRSPERRLFKIDVGGIPPEEVEQYMEKVMTQLKRNKVVDPETGRVDLRYNPMSVEEDYFIPVRAGSMSDIGTLPGGQFTGDIDDVEYLRDKLFSALKIPRSYLARGKDSDEDKATLAQKDIRFARTVQRLQRSIISELEKIAIVHLYTLGFRDEDLVGFTLSLNNPSKLAELQDLEHWRVKFEVASGATEGFFSKRWIAKHMFNLSEEEYIRNQTEMYHDIKFAADLEAAAEPEGAADEMAAAGDLGGGELGGGELGDEDLGDEEPPPEEEGVLLAEPEGEALPGKRDVGKWGDIAYIQYNDGSYETKGAKGHKYVPVSNSKNKTKNGTAGRRKNQKALAGMYKQNPHPGAKGLSSVAKGFLQEEEAIYKAEKKLFTSNYEINKLVENLEKHLDENEA